MATEADLNIQYSGGVGNANPLLSLGGEPSGVTVPATIENIFGNADATEVINGYTDYRMVYVLNDGNAAINSISTILNNQLNTPAQLYLGYYLVNDFQRFIFSPVPLSGSITFTYTDIFLNKYVLSPITYTTPSDLAISLQNQLNALTNTAGQDILGGVVCGFSLVATGFELTVGFNGASGNKFHYLLTQTNNLGVSVNAIKAIDGSPINTVPDQVLNPTSAPRDPIFYLANNAIPLGTLLNNPQVSGEGEYLPVWIKRQIPAGSQAQEVAGATLVLSGLVYPPLPTPTMTASPTPTITFTPSPTPTASVTPTPTFTATSTPTPTPTSTEATPTFTVSPTFSATPTATPTVTPSPTPSPSASLGPYSMQIMGANANGANGLNLSTGFVCTPSNLGTGYDWQELRFGVYYFAGAITTGGQLATWGLNDTGMLGLGDVVNRSVPTFLSDGSGISWQSNGFSLAAGNNFMAGIKSNGTWWSWGNNVYGQLGTNNLTRRSSPVQITTANNWYSVACGWDFTLALNNAGVLYGCGNNYFGQIGNSSRINASSPTQINFGGTWAFPTSSRTTFSASYHNLAIDTLGRLWSWGSNSFGQLGNNNLAVLYSSPVMIGTGYVATSCGRFHSMGLKSDGSLWTWGYNSYGQLGTGNTVYFSSPVQVAGTWVSIGAGQMSSYGIKSSGVPYAWGRASTCQLGTGTSINCSVPTIIATAGTNWEFVSGGYFNGGLK